MSIGSRMRSMKIWAVATLLLSEGSLGACGSMWVASFKSWETAFAARSRAASWRWRLNLGSLCFSNRGTSYSDGIFDDSFDNLGAERSSLSCTVRPSGV